ncbi:MAG: SRPBCC domain-containing protein [Hyphomonadaceae bacterium]
MNELPTYVLERSFTAPRELVWQAWTDEKLFARWYGPNVETIIHQQDLRGGGVARIEMRMGGGSSYQTLSYLEVTPPSRLVFLNANTDEHWRPAANARMPDWPRNLLTTVTFAQNGPQTELRLEWTPHEASAAEIACFAASMQNMGMGWNGGMEILAKILAELQSTNS